MRSPSLRCATPEFPTSGEGSRHTRALIETRSRYVQGLRQDVTPRQDTLSGVIICPSTCGGQRFTAWLTPQGGTPSPLSQLHRVARASSIGIRCAAPRESRRFAITRAGNSSQKRRGKLQIKEGGEGGATLRAKGMRVPPVRLLFCMQWTKCFAIPRRRLQRPNYVCPSTPHTAPGSLRSRRRGSATAAWRLHRSGRDRASPAGLYPHSAAALCSAR